MCVICGINKWKIGTNLRITEIDSWNDIFFYYSIFENDLSFFDYVEPDLNLYGLHLLYLANTRAVK